MKTIAAESTGCRLRDALAVRGIDPSRLAKRIGVDTPTVLGWVLEGKKMRLRDILMCAWVLRVRPAWLALGEEPVFIGLVTNRAVTADNCLAIFDALAPEQREAWILAGRAMLDTGAVSRPAA